MFTIIQESELGSYLLKCSNHYYGLSATEVKQLAYQFAEKLGIDYPDSWNESKMAGKHWFSNFMKRNEHLTLRSPEHTSLNRVNAFCKQNVDNFFNKYGQLLAQTTYDGCSIWNMDETGFSTVPSKLGKVICLRGKKRVGQIVSAERGTMVTMALAVNAAGNSMPPFFLFPRKKMQSTFLDNASTGAIGFANESGWMCQPEFLRFMQHFVKHSKASAESPVLLLLDNHGSHLSIEALDLAAANGVTLLTFPPHCSHRMQPLDVTVYGPVKTFYKSQCTAWQRNNAKKVLEIRHIAGLVATSLDLALTPKNIKSGFSASGIFPFNPDVFDDSDFVQAEFGGENEEQIQATAEQSTSTVPPSLSSVLCEIGPLQPPRSPKKKSNRGRKPMMSTVLTTSESISLLKERRAKNELKKTAPKRASSKRLKAPKKKLKPALIESESEDEDFCIICLQKMPLRLTTANSIKCSSCEREVHLKCVRKGAKTFICKHCASAEDV